MQRLKEPGDSVPRCDHPSLEVIVWFVPRGDVTKQLSTMSLPLSVCVCACVCHFYIHHVPQRDPVASLCSVLINPVMTEWIWQVGCVFGPGWKVRWGNTTVGLMPNPPRAKDPFLDRCSVWGSSSDSLMIQSRRLSPHIGQAQFVILKPGAMSICLTTTVCGWPHRVWSKV